MRNQNKVDEPQTKSYAKALAEGALQPNPSNRAHTGHATEAEIMERTTQAFPNLLAGRKSYLQVAHEITSSSAALSAARSPLRNIPPLTANKTPPIPDEKQKYYEENKKTVEALIQKIKKQVTKLTQSENQKQWYERFTNYTSQKFNVKNNAIETFNIAENKEYFEKLSRAYKNFSKEPKPANIHALYEVIAEFNKNESLEIDINLVNLFAFIFYKKFPELVLDLLHFCCNASIRWANDSISSFASPTTYVFYIRHATTFQEAHNVFLLAKKHVDAYNHFLCNRIIMMTMIVSADKFDKTSLAQEYLKEALQNQSRLWLSFADIDSLINEIYRRKGRTFFNKNYLKIFRSAKVDIQFDSENLKLYSLKYHGDAGAVWDDENDNTRKQPLLEHKDDSAPTERESQNSYAYFQFEDLFEGVESKSGKDYYDDGISYEHKLETQTKEQIAYDIRQLELAVFHDFPPAHMYLAIYNFQYAINASHPPALLKALEHYEKTAFAFDKDLWKTHFSDESEYYDLKDSFEIESENILWRIVMLLDVIKGTKYSQQLLPHFITLSDSLDEQIKAYALAKLAFYYKEIGNMGEAYQAKTRALNLFDELNSDISGMLTIHDSLKKLVIPMESTSIAVESESSSSSLSTSTAEPQSSTNESAKSSAPTIPSPPPSIDPSPSVEPPTAAALPAKPMLASTVAPLQSSTDVSAAPPSSAPSSTELSSSATSISSSSNSNGIAAKPIPITKASSQHDANQKKLKKPGRQHPRSSSQAGFFDGRQGFNNSQGNESKSHNSESTGKKQKSKNNQHAQASLFAQPASSEYEFEDSLLADVKDRKLKRRTVITKAVRGAQDVSRGARGFTLTIGET